MNNMSDMVRLASAIKLAELEELNAYVSIGFTMQLLSKDQTVEEMIARIKLLKEAIK